MRYVLIPACLLFVSGILAEQEGQIARTSLEQNAKTINSVNRRWSLGAILGATVTASYRAQQSDFIAFSGNNTQHIQSYRSLPGQGKLALGGNVGFRIRRNIVMNSSVIYHTLTELIEESIENRSVSSNTWDDQVLDVPIVICYEFNLPVRPFLGLGGAARIHDSIDPLFGGIAYVAGMRIGIKSIYIVPQIRYTRWIVDADLKTNRNQVQILIAFSY